MKSRILAFAGSKQSGKNTCTNFLHGYQLRSHRVIDDFGITGDGDLVIGTKIINADGKAEAGKAFLDVGSSDPEFAEWASYNMWPYIKSYSFAAPLKQISTALFELGSDQVYGKDNQKNSATIFRWEEMPAVITDEKLAKQKDIKKLIDTGVLRYHKPGRMSAREFLQFFGTDLCRKVYEDVWQSKLIKDVLAEEPLIAVIDDCRFPNEATAIQESNGKVIRLTRNIFKDSHASEQSLSSYDNFDGVIDNANLSIHETNVELIKLLNEWGWLGAEIAPDPEPEEKIPEPTLVGGIHKFKEDN
tara:strand:- start:463 stop:1368 length:906 start_codon:yes stop_codon:yes gene_type:complete